MDTMLALGSNLGDRLENLRRAVHELVRSDALRVERLSSVWETPPVPEGQPSFYNAVVRGFTSLEPEELLRRAKAIEAELGRTPTWRWGPRTIDIDILFVGDRRVSTPELTVPHPRIAERAFVLLPLMEVAPSPLPVLGRTARELLDWRSAAAFVRIGPLTL